MNALTKQLPKIDSLLLKGNPKADSTIQADTEYVRMLIEEAGKEDALLSGYVLWAVAIFVILALIALVFIPPLLTKEVRGDAVRIELENKVRLTIAQTIAGLGLVLTFLTAFIGTRTDNKQFLKQMEIQTVSDRIERMQQRKESIEAANAMLISSNQNAVAMINAAKENALSAGQVAETNKTAIIEAADRNKDALLQNTKTLDATSVRNFQAKELEVYESTKKELFIKAIEYLNADNTVSEMSGLEILRDLSTDPKYEQRVGRIVNEYVNLHSKKTSPQELIMSELNKRIGSVQLLSFSTRTQVSMGVLDLGERKDHVLHNLYTATIFSLPAPWTLYDFYEEKKGNRRINIRENALAGPEFFELLWNAVNTLGIQIDSDIIQDADLLGSTFLKAMSLDTVGISSFPGAFDVDESREIDVAFDILAGLNTYKSIFKTNVLRYFPTHKIRSAENSVILVRNGHEVRQIGKGNLHVIVSDSVYRHEIVHLNRNRTPGEFFSILADDWLVFF